MTTQILTSTPLSKKTKLIDGTPLELDSDGMVYVVYPDGARAYAPDGVQTLIDGTTITVNDGRRVP
jgi:hypothetical protein